MGLIKFVRNTSLGYSKIVIYRTNLLKNDEEKIDIGIVRLGVVAFDS
jgi:hypothetical protein